MYHNRIIINSVCIVIFHLLSTGEKSSMYDAHFIFFTQQHYKKEFVKIDPDSSCRRPG